MLVKEVMNTKVVSSGPDISIKEAARIMADNHVGSIIIKRNDIMTGIVTEHNVLEAVGKYENLEIPVSDIMVRYVIFTKPDATIEEACRIMAKNKIKKLPVLKDEKLVGIVTSTDIITAAPGIIKSMQSLLRGKK